MKKLILAFVLGIVVASAFTSHAEIFDRVGADDSISVHLVLGLLTMIDNGDATKNEALAALNATVETPLDAREQAQFNSMVTTLAGLTDSGDKAQYLNRIHSYLICKEHRVTQLTKTKFNNRLGL